MGQYQLSDFPQDFSATTMLTVRNMQPIRAEPEMDSTSVTDGEAILILMAGDFFGESQI